MRADWTRRWRGDCLRAARWLSRAARVDFPSLGFG